MTTLKDLEAQLLSLTPSEQAAIIQLLSNKLANTWNGISKTSAVMGGDACLRETRIPVWLLVNYRRLGLSDAKILDNYPTLSDTDLTNAWAYAEAFPDEIEMAIRKHDEA